MNRLTQIATTHVLTGTLVLSQSFTLAAAGNRTRIDEPGGMSRAYTYDDLYRLTSETISGPLSYAKAFSYDPVGNRLTQATTGAGAPGTPTASGMNSSTYDVRDPEGRLVRHIDAFGKTIEYTHDVAGREELVVDRNGSVRLLEYDVRGNVVREVAPEGHLTTRTFDARNNRLSEPTPKATRPRGPTTPPTTCSPSPTRSGT